MSKPYKQKGCLLFRGHGIFTSNGQCNCYTKWNLNHFLKLVLQKILYEYVKVKLEIINREHQR